MTMSDSNRTENSGVIISGSVNSGVIAGSGAIVHFQMTAPQTAELDSHTEKLLAALNAVTSSPAQAQVVADQVAELKDCAAKGDKAGFEKKARSLETIMESFGKSLKTAADAIPSIRAIGALIGLTISFLV